MNEFYLFDFRNISQACMSLKDKDVVMLFKSKKEEKLFDLLIS
jgi:hypothetical protein